MRERECATNVATCLCVLTERERERELVRENYIQQQQQQRRSLTLHQIFIHTTVVKLISMCVRMWRERRLHDHDVDDSTREAERERESGTAKPPQSTSHVIF